MNLSFDNTEKAFAHKSNQDLKKAYWLFKTFAYPLVVKYGPGLTNAVLSMGIPIKGMIKNTIFHQFCGGETIVDSYPSAQQLYENNIHSILDYSVEGEGSPESYKQTFNELLNVIREAADKKEYPFAVFKCTGICSFSLLQKHSEGKTLTEQEKLEWLEFEERIDTLATAAANNNIQLLIDAEETWIQKAIDEVAYKVIAKHNTQKCVVFNTIQLYRTGRIEEMTKQIELAKDSGYKLGFKLVRGAYMEKERERAEEMGYTSPIQPNKEATDSDYNEAVTLCFDNRDIVSVMAGSHNEESAYHLVNLISNNKEDKKDRRFWFAQLYGMSDHISFNLAKNGYNVAKYLPYGPVKKVLPYLSRRAQENTSVKGQSGRELSLIKKELKRRRLSN